MLLGKIYYKKKSSIQETENVKKKKKKKNAHTVSTNNAKTNIFVNSTDAKCLKNEKNVIIFEVIWGVGGVSGSGPW